MLDPSRVAPPLWRDGAGATRELAAATDAHGEMLWRISVADLELDEPFTAFPRFDRLLVTLRPLRLTVDGRQQRLAARDQVRFAGEAQVAVAPARPLGHST